MELHDALNALSQDTLLSSMPRELGHKLARRAEVRLAPAGTTVCRQGQPADKLIFPVDGALRLEQRDETGAIASETQLSPRRALNLGAVVDAEHWEYSAITDGPVHLLEIDGALFREALAAEPAYEAYLQLITRHQTIRETARALRRGGARPESIQGLIARLELREVAPGNVTEVDGPALWIIVESGAFELVLSHLGEQHVVSPLAPGEFYGAGAMLGPARPLQARCLEAGEVFVLDPAALRDACAGQPALERALRQESPEVQRRVRRALIEIGAEFTRVMSAPPTHSQDFTDDETGTLSSATIPRALGRPWDAPVAQRRRIEGIRCDTEEDCAAAALVAILKMHDRVPSISAVRRALGRRLPASLLDLALVAERQGFSSHASKLPNAKALTSIELPALATIDHRYVVVLEVRRRGVCFFDPLFGLHEASYAELEKRSSLAVLELRDVRLFLNKVVPPPAEEEDDQKARQPQQAPQSARERAWEARFAYLQLLSSSKPVLATVAVIALALLLLGLVGPRLNALVIDGVLVHGDFAMLKLVTIGLLLVNASQFLLSGVRQICLSYTSAWVDFRLSTLTIRHSLGVALDSHGDDRVGTVLERMNELERIRISLVEDLIDVVFQLAQGAVFLIWTFTYSVKLGLIALGTVPVAYVIARFGGTRFRTLYLKLFAQSAKMKSQTTEQIESVATMKALSGSASARRRWERTLVDGIELQRSVLNVRLGTVVGMELLEESARVAGLYLGVTLVLDGALTAGAVLAVSQYLSGALNPLISLAGKLDELEQLGISFRKLDELFRLPIEDEELGPARPEPAFDGDIVARNVTFRYEPEMPPVVKNLSFSIARGETIAVVGRSGSGKTTLAKLLQGGLRPSTGEIFFDEQENRTISISTLRRNVGIVMQDSQLFAGTIEENIAYGDDVPDEDRVREAARLAAAHDFIAKFPNGYQTYLAEGGLGLSGGQRQRINIARALYRDPRILILDEATSALDAESERAIMGNMRDILRGRTAIVIAHRLHTVKHADRILVIDQGEIVEEGTHSELIAKRGLYHSLYGQQFNQA